MPAVEPAPSLVAAAVSGDQRALEQLLRAVADEVYRLAQRMLWHPQDAEDATQEILVKVATRLSTYRGDARVSTWVHRIAVNHLLSTRRRRAEDPTLTFAAFGEDLARDLDATYHPRGVDDELLAQEVMVGCTQGMLLCLDREHRMAYILGEVLELSSDQAAELCGIAPSAFRKRRQRARERIQQFMQRHTAGCLTRPTPAAAGAGSGPPSATDASTRTTSCSHGESPRSSSTWSASPTPARSSAATPSCAHRHGSSTPCCGRSLDPRSAPARHPTDRSRMPSSRSRSLRLARRIVRRASRTQRARRGCAAPSAWRPRRLAGLRP